MQVSNNELLSELKGIDPKTFHKLNNYVDLLIKKEYNNLDLCDTLSDFVSVQSRIRLLKAAKKNFDVEVVKNSTK